MLLTLLKALNTTDLSVLAGNLDMPPLDIDVLLYEAQENGEIEIDKENNKIKRLKEPDYLYSNHHLYEQIRKIVKFYDQQESNITRSRLEMVALNPNGNLGYSNQDFVCTMYAIEQDGSINHYEIEVKGNKKKNRPAHTFKFYTYLDHQEFGAKAVNDFIAQFDKK